MDRIKEIRTGIFKRVMIISIALLFILHFNIERTAVPPIEEEVTTPSEDSSYGRTGTRGDNGTAEGNFTPLRSHIRTFINGGSSDEFLGQHFDVIIDFGMGRVGEHQKPNNINLLYDYFGTMVAGASNQKYQALLDYCDLHNLTSNELEDMFLHAKEDVNYTLGEPLELDPKVTKLVPGWDPVNDLNGDYHVNDTEFASRANPNASARYKNESRIPIYYWGPPTDYVMNIGNDDYLDFIVNYYAPKILEENEGYDGLFLDTLRTTPAVQGDTEVLEYPVVSNYTADIKTLLSDLKSSLPNGTIIVGNGWYSDPIIISGSEYENWARITTSIDPAKLDTIIDRDEKGNIQLIQYNPIYDEIANPNRPDYYIEGVTLERDQLYSLALYYLVHGNHTYYGYGVHGGYSLDEEKWFDAINYDIGQPLGSYYIFDDSSGYTKETNNILINGDFDIDDDSDGNPDYWVAAEPVELDPDIKYEGNYSVKIQSDTEINNINWQSVSLEPYATYTLSGRIKTENVTGQGAQIYIYEFSDLQESDSWIVVKDTTDWTFYSMTFTTGSDTEGNIKYRIKDGTGTAWFDDFHLTTGSYDKYTVFSRDFQNATVLLRNPFNAGDNTTIAYDLDGNYSLLNADGILGTPAETIELMGGQGVILIRESTLGNYTILKQGWNLISVPMIQTEQDLPNVLDSIDGLYDAVQWHDSKDSNDPWKHHKVSKPYGNDLFELNETQGFWIHITRPGDTIFIYNGTQLTQNQTITLHPGWNMVGYPSLRNHNRTEGLNNIIFGTHVDSILTYNAAEPKYKKLGPSDYFEPGKGYYIHAKSECTWEVPL
ncbi:MAG: carbohydrate binding domain-containing protein [Thermoplasmata archaeon]|nr:MAG: carbohydrate binding domain-containing protein [Thermoplasmata archaeon]